MCKIPTTVIVLHVLLDFMIQAIIVERNLHSYYRLPTTTVKTSNETEDYYILQCPFKSSLHIPKPKNMPVCIIVGRHSLNEEKQKQLLKAKPSTTLHTQVDYRQLKPTKLLKLVKIKNGKPYTMLLKPTTKKARLQTKFLPHPKVSLNQSSTVLYHVPIVHKILLNDSSALSSTNQPQKLRQSLKPPSKLELDFIDDPLDEEDSEPSPLKYLGVKDTLKHLKPPPPPINTNQSSYKVEKFFDNLKDYKKGFRTKGYQNMYHRDEIYQDHIFYDDLQQTGNYRIREKVRGEKP